MKTERSRSFLVTLLALLLPACGPRDSLPPNTAVPETVAQVIRNVIAKAKPGGCSVASVDCRLEKWEMDRLWVVAQAKLDCDFKGSPESLEISHLCRVKIYASNRETNVIQCDCIPYDGLRITPEHYERLEKLARP